MLILYYIKKNMTFGIITQYLLTIAYAIYSIILLCIGKSSSTEMFFQILIALSSNCCSIACTLSFLKKEDEDPTFQSKRTIIIVVSLAMHLVLTMLLPDILSVATNERCRILILLMLSCVVMYMLLHILYTMQSSVEGKNAMVAEMTFQQKDIVEKANNLSDETVDDYKFNFNEISST